MKKIKSIRLNENYINAIDKYASNKGLNFNQVIEKCIKDNKEIKLILVSDDKEIIKNDDKINNDIRLNFNLSKDIIRKIKMKANIKGCSMPQEIRYRLSASLELPCFDTVELISINNLKTDVNKIGNLINISIRNNLMIKDNNVIELIDLISKLKIELHNLILLTSKRIL